MLILAVFFWVFFENLMKLLEPVNGAVEKKIRSALLPTEDPLIQVSTDMDHDGAYGRVWLVATADRVLVIPEGGSDGTVEVAIRDIARVRSEALVGGYRLELERNGKPGISLLYSRSLGEKFAEVSRGIEQLRKGRPLRVNNELDRIRCDKCNRLLPVRGGICPACTSRVATLLRIARYLKPYWSSGLLLAVASILNSGAELLPPLITRALVDEVLVPVANDGGDLEARVRLLGLLVLGLVTIRLFGWAMEWIHGWTVSWLAPRVTADIQSQLYRRLEMLSLEFYDKRKAGALISRASRDSRMLQNFLVDGLPYLIINALTVAGILVFLIWMSWSLSVYVILPVPLMMIWGTFYWPRLRRFFTKWGQRWSSLTDRTQETLAGIRLIKSFVQEDREIRLFARINREVRKIGVDTAIHRGIFFATISFLTGMGVLAVWLFGGREVLLGSITLGTLMAFYAYMTLLYSPLEWFGQVNSWMSRAFASAERIFEVIDTRPERYDDPDAVPMPEIQGSISFRDATFGYDKSKPVLHGLDFDIAAREMIGLVGKSGAGKTTTINLIARFYEADEGTIEIDGVDIRKIRLEDLRRQIGIVLQEPVLFSGSIAANIAYGKPGASMEEIMSAARTANAHDFIVTKPDGYNSILGEKGINLAGGERQRISIARAILHNPKILILDEATSSVDVETETKIQDAIAKLIEGRTTIAIAHRLSTLRYADRLIVIDEGRIVEAGTHAELNARRGIFHNLVRLQREASAIIAVD